MLPAQDDSVVVTRRSPYGIEYLDRANRWTLFLDEAQRFPSRTQADSIANAVGATCCVSTRFAREWARTAERDVMGDSLAAAT